MNAFRQRLDRWLLPTVMILFILQLALLPLAADFTYAGHSETPDHVLTYSKGQLSWDPSVNVRPDGTAEMELFFAEYGDTVISGNGDDIAAPGTGEDYFLRLRNTVSGPVTYTAVLFQLADRPSLPINAKLTGENFTDTETYPLPQGVERENVLRAVTGTVTGLQLQDLLVDWAWDFYVSDEQDIADTDLGNGSVPESVTVGLYIVVDDGNSYLEPDPPYTGVESHFGMYIALMLISLVVLILLLIDRRRKEDESETD